MMDEFKLVDVWRNRNEEKKEFSWIKTGSFPIKASRIYFALTSSGLDQHTQTIQYISSIKTDHRAVYMVIEIGDIHRGVGYWKMNTSFLQQPEYIQMINDEIELTINSMTQSNPAILWEKLKKRVKEISIKYARNKGNQDSLVIAQLSEKVNEYEANLPLTREEDKLWNETRAELEEKTMERIKGVMFRSKVKWYEEGEKILSISSH